jgi:hypothetical protein
MDELGIGIGVRVVVTDARTLGVVGIAHVPAPVRPDDLIAFAEGIRGVCSRFFPRLEAGGSNLATLRLALRVDASNPSSGA